MACLRWPSSPLCPPGQRACAPLVEADVAGSHRALARAFDSALGSYRLSKSESPSPAIVRFFWRDSWTPALGMARRDWGAPWVADTFGVGLVVAVSSYTSLIVSKLVPKRIALHGAEQIAVRVAPAMTILAHIASPLVWLLHVSGDPVLRRLGSGAKPRNG